MIDANFVSRLDQLEKDRFQLVRQAAGYRLQAFNTIEALAPQATKLDRAVAALRYAREHWVLAGTLLAVAGYILQKRLGMLGVAQLALRLGSNYFAH